MAWLRVARWIGPVVLLAWGELALVPGCSNGDDSSPAGSVGDASQPPPTRFEAGANCAATADCEPGLVCLVPASACNALPVCVAAPWFADGGVCDQPQSACSCLGEVIQVCHGYATNPVDTTATCEGGTATIPEAGADAGPPAIEAGAGDAGDAGGSVDAAVDAGGAGPDASDAAASD